MCEYVVCVMCQRKWSHHHHHHFKAFPAKKRNDDFSNLNSLFLNKMSNGHLAGSHLCDCVGLFSCSFVSVRRSGICGKESCVIYDANARSLSKIAAEAAPSGFAPSARYTETRAMNFGVWREKENKHTQRRIGRINNSFIFMIRGLWFAGRRGAVN